VLHVPKTVIPLASSVLDPSVYPPVEKAMGIEIAKYALAGPRETVPCRAMPVLRN
jgi:hypothetical protein